MTTDAIGTELRVTLRVDEDLTLVVLAGPLDIYTTPQVREIVDPHALAGERIVVDLSEVTLIDSRGLGSLMRLRDIALREGAGQVGVVCPRRHLRRVFEITGLRAAFAFGRDLPAVRARLDSAGPR